MADVDSFLPDPDHLFRALGIEPAMMVVDVCSGDSRFIAALAGFVGGKLYVFDIDAEVVKRTRAETERLGVAVRGWIWDDTEELPRVLPEPVDFTLMTNVLHGVSDLKAIANAVHSALKPGGTFGIVDWRKLSYDELDVRQRSSGPENRIRVSPDDLRLAVEPSGFAFDKNIDLPPYHFGVTFHKYSYRRLR